MTDTTDDYAEWMDGEGGYRDWYEANHGTASSLGDGPVTQGGPGTPPPPPPKK